jgi:hypothetical protein
LHAPEEHCAALGDGGHLFSHPACPPLMTGERKGTRIMYSQLLETILICKI